jgi:hypothetical protein
MVTKCIILMFLVNFGYLVLSLGVMAGSAWMQAHGQAIFLGTDLLFLLLGDMSRVLSWAGK